MKLGHARNFAQILAVYLVLAIPFMATAEDPSFDFFEQHVRPVFIENCYSCHSAEAEAPKGGLSLDSREGTLEGRQVRQARGCARRA